MRIKQIGLGIVLLAALTGCVGYVGGGYGDAVVVPEPDMYVFGGFYERGRDVHDYSHRGFESRAVAHRVGGGPERRPPPMHPTTSSSVHRVGGKPERKR
jgi:hypothetical protein